MQMQSQAGAKAQNGHVAALDGVRGLAVLSVFILHYGGGAQSTNWLVHGIGTTIKLGWAGVTLFFVLSGFLITGILWRSRDTPHWWRNFYVRRCLRIFPLYYFVLILIFLISIFHYRIGQVSTYLGVFALYLQNFVPWSGKVQVLPPFRLGHFWSLAVEEHFYLVWPFLLARMSSIRRAQYLCLAVFLLSMATRVWFAFSGYTDFYCATPARVGELAIGAWLALVLRENAPWVQQFRRVALPLFLGCVVILAAIVWGTGATDISNSTMYVLGVPIFSFGAVALIVLALNGQGWSRWLSFPPLRYLGVTSYGIYVYHIILHDSFDAIVTRLAPHASRNTHLVILFFVGAALTLAVAQCSYTLLEQPLLKLKDRVAPTVAPRVATPV